MASPDHARFIKTLADLAIVKTRPLNDEQRETVNAYMRVRDWVYESVPFDLHDERVAGMISEDE